MRGKPGIGMALAIILILIVTCAISWIVTCGIIKLITLCLGLTFKWFTATGIWLAFFLVTVAPTKTAD